MKTWSDLSSSNIVIPETRSTASVCSHAQLNQLPNLYVLPLDGSTFLKDSMSMYSWKMAFFSLLLREVCYEYNHLAQKSSLQALFYLHGCPSIVSNICADRLGDEHPILVTENCIVDTANGTIAEGGTSACPMETHGYWKVNRTQLLTRKSRAKD